MLNSVRARLTFWYVGVLSLALIAFGIAVYTLLARKARADADLQLSDSIEVLTRALRHEIEEHGGKQAGEEAFAVQALGSAYRDLFPSIGIAIYDGSRLVASKPGAGGIVPERPMNSPPGLQFRQVRSRGHAWRQAALTSTMTNAGSYDFVSLISLVPVEEELRSVRRILFLAIPLALILAAIGGIVLVRKNLSPMVAMSDTANRISSRDLSERIPVQNPKDELGRLATTLNQLLGRLDIALSNQRQFMEDASHELRTPIFVAHTAAQVMLQRQRRTEEEYRESLTTIDQQLKRLQHLVEELFVLARADTGTYPVQMTEFDLGEIIADSVRAAKLLAEQKQSSVIGPPLQELSAYGDEGLIRQLILILLDNAVKYTPKGGVVQVHIESVEPNEYSILVRDSGLGIPADSRERIFDRFYRVDKSRSRAAANGVGGAGLGLSIAKWITELHNGSLTLAETGEQGSTFCVKLPRP